MLGCVSICPLIDPFPVRDGTSAFIGLEIPLHLAKWSPVGSGCKTRRLGTRKELLTTASSSFPRFDIFELQITDS